MTDRTLIDTEYARVVDDLSYEYEGTFSRVAVSAAVEEARRHLEPVATVRGFLPVLAGRFARDQLLAEAQAEGRVAKAVPEVVFLCVRNTGRSQLAAAIAAHLAGPRVHVRSAGSHPEGGVDLGVVAVLAERGIVLEEAFAKPLTDRVVRAADVIVTMGCGDTCPVYPGKRYLDWQVGDPHGKDPATVRTIADDVEARVAALLADLGV